MGFFDGLDFNRDGKVDGFEAYVGMQMMASSRKKTSALAGADAFYAGSDFGEEEDDGLIDEIEMAGLDMDELADMNKEERREALEDAGIDPDAYDDF